ncbi:MAG: SRPBCC domain-containing protein [Gracilimonas sp.]
MDKVVIQTAIINTSAEEAFYMFTENSHLENWLTVKADVELRVGGKYELFWTPDDPEKTNNSTYGCKILAFEKPHYLNFEWRGNAEQKEFMNTDRPLTNVTVVFSKLGENQTKVSLIHTGWRPDQDWEAARQYFVNAWKGAFSQLQKYANVKE